MDLSLDVMVCVRDVIRSLRLPGMTWEMSLMVIGVILNGAIRRGSIPTERPNMLCECWYAIWGLRWIGLYRLSSHRRMVVVGTDKVFLTDDDDDDVDAVVVVGVCVEADNDSF